MGRLAYLCTCPRSASAIAVRRQQQSACTRPSTPSAWLWPMRALPAPGAALDLGGELRIAEGARRARVKGCNQLTPAEERLSGAIVCGNARAARMLDRATVGSA